MHKFELHLLMTTCDVRRRREQAFWHPSKSSRYTPKIEDIIRTRLVNICQPVPMHPDHDICELLITPILAMHPL